ncbi:sigma-54 dependent transcriptional regulator [Flavobacterium sp. NKUCC04_CG]|uniref:sigma-54-dependent transcriptional regulator n=1 Tax=Flavobacterium sp. NKUCC04_CG TaxID=2842121 RepID=UPI001C5AC66A|nr:sigma-54 dependent transcriptional regulator [Flavobacterium sp. NKUCC04_CG]MBW3519142.1 sigma-54 dependent transcriptional regulator [Flavobacterium sp. NKUCC04_CG]
MNPILIIDDEVKLRSLLARIMELEGFEVVQASDLKTGFKKLEQHTFDVVLCDVKLPDGSGVDFSKKVKDRFPLVELILMTAYGNIPDGVQAIKNGAYDYIIKGEDNNKIIPLLYRAMEKVKLNKRVEKLESQLEQKYSFDKTIGKSAALLQAVQLAKRVATTATTVLLTGETGTGKEVFAQSIHHESSRKKQSFVAINCAAFSKDLLESEMFGHKAGSFTNAIKDQKGLFEEAHLGTIFLDEIGELPLDLQAKLLRVLETGTFLKIGDSKPTTVDIRIIAATNRDLTKEIQQGNFREDLYYRLSVFPIELPALRNRISDIAELVDHFLKMMTLQSGKKTLKPSKEALEALKAHAWPGNIRELKNALERAIIMNNGDVLELIDLPIEFQKHASVSAKTISSFELAYAEKNHILSVLKYTNGNKTKTAELLGIALTTLYRKLEEYRLG